MQQFQLLPNGNFQSITHLAHSNESQGCTKLDRYGIHFTTLKGRLSHNFKLGTIVCGKIFKIYTYIYTVFLVSNVCPASQPYSQWLLFLVTGSSPKLALT